MNKNRRKSLYLNRHLIKDKSTNLEIDEKLHNVENKKNLNFNKRVSCLNKQNYRIDGKFPKSNQHIPKESLNNPMKEIFRENIFLKNTKPITTLNNNQFDASKSNIGFYHQIRINEQYEQANPNIFTLKTPTKKNQINNEIFSGLALTPNSYKNNSLNSKSMNCPHYLN